MAVKLAVIGGGPGGYVAAIRAASLGADVTIIEKENFGGTCLNWGCIPSKIMKNSADLYNKLKKSASLGITITGELSFDMDALMERKNKVLESQRKGIESLLQGHQINIEKGRAKIVSPGHIDVADTATGKSIGVDYDHLIIATGTEPLNVSDFPFDHERILSSNDILEIDSVPESIVIIGGGVIGCEFAFIFASLGSQVTVVEALSRLLPLPAVDESCSKILLREMKKAKIKVICDTVVTGAVQNGDQLDITIDDSPFTDNPRPKKAGERQITGSKMAVCIGRSPLSVDLGLETIGVETDDRGWIKVNENLQTNIENVWAIGDILGPSRVMLAHVASHEGIIAAENILGQKKEMNYDVIPGAIFTMPEIGTVGLSESEALKKCMDIECFSVNFRTLGKAQAIDEIAGEVKVIVNKADRTLLGVHMIGPHATDLIAEATLAIQQKVTVEQIAHTIHAHPTLAEIMGEVALKASGSAIHG
ncbi:MAG: dihydrolipoyl dehydrogenase [Desulfobacteraceae bacterium]|nr:MAG: dihydrolipoyl dehydrogenase [Desulfobacteraceae bacterium]